MLSLQLFLYLSLYSTGIFFTPRRNFCSQTVVLECWQSPTKSRNFRPFRCRKFDLRFGQSVIFRFGKEQTSEDVNCKNLQLFKNPSDKKHIFILLIKIRAHSNSTGIFSILTEIFNSSVYIKLVWFSLKVAYTFAFKTPMLPLFNIII